MIVVAAVVAFAGLASAHVVVTPSTAAQGGFSQLTFRVPNEKDDASTVKVTVTLPSDHPLAAVSVKPVPGWTSSTTKAAPSQKVEVEGIPVDEVVTSVTWEGGRIDPGQFQEFSISVGPLPTDTDELTFDAQQTYSDGSVVDWNQPTPASGEEPEHPAPSVQLVKAAAGEHDDDTDTPTAISADVATHEDVDAAESRGTIGLVLGGLGLVIGIVALVVALRRRGPAAR